MYIAPDSCLGFAGTVRRNVYQHDADLWPDNDVHLDFRSRSDNHVHYLTRRWHDGHHGTAGNYIGRGISGSGNLVEPISNRR